jgi:hypothetical protein
MLRVPYGKPEFGFGDIEDSGDFFVYYVEPISSQCIRIWFSNEVVNNSQYLNKDNYVITSSLGILPIQSVLPTSFEVSSAVLLYIRPQTENVEYTVTISNLTDRSGDSLLTNTASWIYNKTKCDSILSSMPSMYDKSPKSNLFKILNAISYSDNQIGGAVTEIPEE